MSGQEDFNPFEEQKKWAQRVGRIEDVPLGKAVDPKCRDCRFWFESGRDPFHKGKRYNECRRGPARHCLDETDLGFWLRTKEDDWCGEFEARREK